MIDRSESVHTLSLDLSSHQLKKEQSLTELPVANISGVCISPEGGTFLWQFGTLFELKAGALQPVRAEMKAIHSAVYRRGKIWLFYVDNTVQLLQREEGGRWQLRRAGRLDGHRLCGVGFSLNDCLVITLSEDRMFESDTQVSVYMSASLEETVYQMGGASSIQSDSMGMLAKAITLFKPALGDYRDVLAMLVSTNKLDYVQNLLESAFFSGDEHSQAWSEQQAMFLKDLAEKCDCPNNQATKVLVGKFILNIYHHTAFSLDKVKKLKAKLWKLIFKQANVETTNGKLSMSQSLYLSCPFCSKDSLKVEMETLSGTCEQCLNSCGIQLKAGKLTPAKQMSHLCRHCGILYPDAEEKCLLCACLVDHIKSIVTN